MLFTSLVLTVVMSSVVKLFITQLKFYKTLGFNISQSELWHSTGSISAKSLFFLIVALQYYITTAVFFLFEAQTADECEMSFYVSITVLVAIVYTSKIAMNINKISELIRNYEEFVDKS